MEVSDLAVHWLSKKNIRLLKSFKTMDLQKKIHKIEYYYLHLQYKRIHKQTQFHEKDVFP